MNVDMQSSSEHELNNLDVESWLKYFLLRIQVSSSVCNNHDGEFNKMLFN